MLTDIGKAAVAVLCAAVLAGCAEQGPQVAPGTPSLAVAQASPSAVETSADEQEIATLAGLIRSLGPSVDAEEAARAARISLLYPRELRSRYGVTDPPIIHNIKVNSGQRPRGLCWHWAEDMEKRLKSENFRTLDIQRAIANAGNPLRLEHSTALITAKGDPWDAGVVVDPWRDGGDLYWSTVPQDTRYPWRAQREVLAEKRKRKAAGTQRNGA
ncbi:hypothetical protein R5H30_17665 [Sulfitobacter sp. D35]|uniref:hypothetical protein n=1 Tax=Sulfitobacter sp. D35 TaxID=3083252 RepID=UPI00296FDC8A|nr:hypothetical protein [Sulfitobacter sp. D35]MDW4499825.1 hypothetical protein [Sulfitobacter sp. D35]